MPNYLMGMPAEPESNSLAIPPENQEKPTLLIVDDEPSMLELLSLMLEAEGYHVLKAKNSDEALDISSAYHGEIKLLITDVKMDPAMTGYELAQCLRLMRVEIKVLYLSGYSDQEMVLWEVEQGLASFLGKPFETTAFRSKVRSLTE